MRRYSAFEAGGKCVHWTEPDNADLLAAWINKDFGLDGVRLWFSQRWNRDEQMPHPDGDFLWYRTCEELEDTARKLDQKGLPHVGDVLREIAEDLPSECEEIIEKAAEEDYYRRCGPHAVKQRKTQRLTCWLFKRVEITGQSWNTLIRHYGLEEWFDPTKPDRICENGRWRYLPMALNGGANS